MISTLRIAGLVLPLFISPSLVLAQPWPSGGPSPNGGVFDMQPLPDLLPRHPHTRLLVDEAFTGMAGESVAHLAPRYPNLLVAPTLSKAHSLAGVRRSATPCSAAASFGTTASRWTIAVSCMS